MQHWILATYGFVSIATAKVRGSSRPLLLTDSANAVPRELPALVSGKTKVGDESRKSLHQPVQVRLQYRENVDNCYKESSDDFRFSAYF
jgi:hypothetical protein